MRRTMLGRRHPAKGQALILVALALGMLVTLIVGVNDIALRRRTQARIQDSLDQAAAAAVTQLVPASLIAGAPTLTPHDAEVRFRTTLHVGLLRVAGAVSPEPAILAEKAHVSFLPAGATCYGSQVTAPAICAELTVTLPGLLGAPQVSFTTLAQATRASE